MSSFAQHEIVSIPSASTLDSLCRDVAGRQSVPKRLAVFADPVFERDDKRVTAKSARASRSMEIKAPLDESVLATVSGIGLERLSFSREEAEKILRLAPLQLRFAALEFAANRSNATSPELGLYQIIHVATHGVLNDAHSELSGIVLSLFDKSGDSRDGFLRLNDLFNLKLNADLVVLSGCKTALGKEVRCEKLIGLARGFM